MGLIKEPKEIDLLIQSEPWTDKELADFRAIMEKQRASRKVSTRKTLIKKQKKHHA